MNTLHVLKVGKSVKKLICCLLSVVLILSFSGLQGTAEAMTNESSDTKDGAQLQSEGKTGNDESLSSLSVTSEIADREEQQQINSFVEVSPDTNASDESSTSKNINQSEECAFAAPLCDTTSKNQEISSNDTDQNSTFIYNDNVASPSSSLRSMDQSFLPHAFSPGKNKIINGDFEAFPASSLDRSSFKWLEVQLSDSQYYMTHNGKYYFPKLTQAQLDAFGWRSIKYYGKDYIEIQIDSSIDNVYGEVCAQNYGTSFYQDIASIPGSVLKWKLSHSSRWQNYTDGMSVNIGVPGSESAQLARRTSSNGASMNSNVANGDTNQIGWESIDIHTPNNRVTKYGDYQPDWESYEGAYKVPASQTTTRFDVKSVVSRDFTSGNLVDNIEVIETFPLWYKSNGGQSLSGVFAGIINSDGSPYTGEDPAASMYINYHHENATPTLATPIDDLSTGDTWDSSMMVYPDAADGRSYEFVGWSKSQLVPLTSKEQMDKAGILTTYPSVSASLSDNVVYAVWGAKPQVSFHSQYAPVSDPPAQTNIAWGGTAITPSGWTVGSTSIRPGYTFEGWCVDAACLHDFDIATSLYSDTVLYAKWSPNSYDVIFNANGGSGTMANQSFTYDVDQPLHANVFAQADHIFMGWNTTPDGKGSAYTDTQSVKNLTQSGSVVLYAQWAPKSDFYKIDASSVTLKSSDARTAFAQATDAHVLESDIHHNVSAQKRMHAQGAWEDASVIQTITDQDWAKIKAGEVGIYPVTYANADDPTDPKLSKCVSVTI
ncbi:MAG: InlB B-repeat-containing protein, partial [Eggerthellaceae bacterium]|nr:InlB B-repeat-containing protein [Eggerthellaceae bacterium]